MKPRTVTVILALVAVAALVGLLVIVFTLYLRPDFMRDLADMTYSCF